MQQEAPARVEEFYSSNGKVRAYLKQHRWRVEGIPTFLPFCGTDAVRFGAVTDDKMLCAVVTLCSDKPCLRIAQLEKEFWQVVHEEVISFDSHLIMPQTICGILFRGYDLFLVVQVEEETIERCMFAPQLLAVAS